MQQENLINLTEANKTSSGQELLTENTNLEVKTENDATEATTENAVTDAKLENTG